jgi:class 3 adenylate cyclase
MLAAIHTSTSPIRTAPGRATVIEPNADAISERLKIPEAPERRHITVMFSDLVGSTALAPLVGNTGTADATRERPAYPS